MMNKVDRIEERKPVLLDVVALLADMSTEKPARGIVGTVVEFLDAKIAMVEFSDDEGRAHAITPVKFEDLLVLHYLPEAVELSQQNPPLQR
jgi:hypothetical protein